MSQKNEEYKAVTPIKATEQPVDLATSQQLDLGITVEYDRKNYDSQTARKNFHDSQFAGRKTITGQDGEVLHKSHSAAKSKYGEKRASYHQAEADHKDPLKSIHERAADNPLLRHLLTDEDIKEVGNRKGNFQELSKHENTSKKANSELQRGVETKDIKRAAKGLQTQAETDLLLAGRATKNAATAFGTAAVAATGAAVEAGKETALVTLTVSGLNNLAAVASGKKDLETALKDVSTDAANSFVSGAGVRMTQEAVAKIAHAAGSEQIANFIANDFPSAEIAMTVMTVSTVKRYLDGDISGEDCAVQLIANVAGTLAYQLGGAIGGPAGAMIASVIMTQMTNTILEYRQEKKIQKERAAEIDAVLSQAIFEISRQKDELASYAKAELKHWDDTISSGFDTILQSAVNQDITGITQGLNTILALFNSQVIYPTLEDFDRDFYNPDAPPLVL